MSARFSQPFKQQAVKKAIMREKGISVKDLADELSIGYSTLQKWIVQTKNHELESSNDLLTNEYSMKHEIYLKWAQIIANY
jgi:transposase-like protein